MKYNHSMGLDIDHYSMRAVVATRKQHGKKVSIVIDKSAEIHGTFIKDNDVSEGLKKLKEKLGGFSSSLRVASVVGGKQVYTGSVPFQKLPEAETKNALKFEIKKELPFESSGSVLQFQKLNNGEMRHDDKIDLMVAATPKALLTRHMRLLTKGGIKPDLVEALPLMVANTFWASARRESVDAANIILHIGPDIATLVIDGEHLPYFNRLIYFAAAELYARAEEEAEVVGKERIRRMEAFAQEVIRSLSYYEENFENVTFSTINVMGAYTASELLESLREETKLDVVVTDLTDRVESKTDLNPGHFDLAIALALQGLE